MKVVDIQIHQLSVLGFRPLVVRGARRAYRTGCLPAVNLSAPGMEPVR